MRLAGGVLMTWMAAAGAVMAEGAAQPVVVELFTSQGCSSCPPADALLAELAGRDDVLALALHVDYWDYIGWADGFARPEYTARQKDYAHMAGSRSVFTPQMIVGGTDHVIGFKPMQLAAFVEEQRAAMGQVELSARLEGERLLLTAKPAEGVVLPEEIDVLLAGFIALERVEIAHGENAGKVLDYANIVTSLTRLESWNGRGELSLEEEVPASDGLAVIVQEAGPGAILAAARLR